MKTIVRGVENAKSCTLLEQGRDSGNVHFFQNGRLKRMWEPMEEKGDEWGIVRARKERNPDGEGCVCGWSGSGGGSKKQRGWGRGIWDLMVRERERERTVGPLLGESGGISTKEIYMEGGGDDRWDQRVRAKWSNH